MEVRIVPGQKYRTSDDRGAHEEDRSDNREAKETRREHPYPPSDVWERAANH
jgi:hypothetical protein